MVFWWGIELDVFVFGVGWWVDGVGDDFDDGFIGV